MKKILALFSPKEPSVPRMREAIDGEFIFKRAEELTEEDMKDVQIILGNPPPKLLASCEKLEWLQLISAGTDGYNEPGVLPEGVLFTNATGAFGLAIAEHMLAGLLFLMKKIGVYYDEMKTHTWGDRGSVTSIYGTRTLIVGFGDLGSEFGIRMHALGSEVIGLRRSVQEKPDWLSGLYTMDKLDELLPEADFVALCLPANRETYHLMDARRLGLMKDSAYILNSGRGSAIDPKALLTALNNETIAGAVLDVTEPEPLPADDPLWDAKNLFISPHVSGGRHLEETYTRLFGIFTENLRRYQNREPLMNVVDPETGHRKAPLK